MRADSGHAKSVPGRLCVDVGGAAYDMTIFADGDSLVLVFADATTGAESYAPGRFLRMDPPGRDGVLTVDFNLAFVPPCGFSDFYSCPIPAPQNRLPLPIRAGEQRVRWA
ncbi:MAG: DUF1684 domain-containing protein [Tetrasphaera sp.]